MRKNYFFSKLIAVIVLLLLPLSFAAAQITVFEEGFESGYPAGWTQETVSGSNVWSIQTGENLMFPKGTTEGVSRAYFRTNNKMPSVVKLITPKIDASQLGLPVVSFSYALAAYPAGAHDVLNVYYRTSESEAWQLIKTYSAAVDNWASDIVSIPETSAQLQIAFEGVDASGHGVVLDNIVIRNQYVCPTAAGLSALNITPYSARLNWSGGNELSTHYLKISTEPITDFTQEALIEDTVYYERNTLQKKLTPSTTYYFYVQSDCGDYGRSEWSPAGTFTTACPPVTDFLESFDGFTAGAGQSLGCWSGFAQTGSLTIVATGQPYVKNSATYAHSGTKSVQLYGSYMAPTTTTGSVYTEAYFVSPALDSVILSGKQLKFWMYASNKNYKLHIGVQEYPDELASFTEIQTVSCKTINTKEEVIVPLNEYKGKYQYIVFQVSGMDAEANVTIYIDDIQLEDLPPCEDTKIVVFNTTAAQTTATISWKPIETTAWNLKVSSVSIDPATGTGDIADASSTTDNPYALSGLNVNTTYYYYVQPVCGENAGKWSDEQTFSTTCGAEGIPLNENFDTYGTVYNGLNNSFPDCWTRIQNASTTQGFPYIETTNFSSPGSLVFYAGSGTYAMAITPELDVENINTLQAVFMGQKTNDAYSLTVGIITDPNDRSTFVPIDTVTTSIVNTWEEFVVSFAGYQGNAKYIAFYTDINSTRDNKFYIDNLTIGFPPARPRPLWGRIKVTDRTDHTVSLSFTPSGTETAWEVAYGAPGFDPNDAQASTIVSVTSKEPAIEGLNSNTDYEFYVRADYGNGEVSTWCGLASTFTRQELASVPYFCDFEDGEGEDLTSEWRLENGTQTNYWTIGGNTSNGGDNSLYITSDGTTNSYVGTTSSSYVFAYRTIDIQDGIYDISFNWKANGQLGQDYLRAFLVPGTVDITAGAANGITSATVVPSGWIDLGGQMNLKTAWTEQKNTLTFTDAGTYHLLFYWKNNAGTNNQPPVAIDSVQIRANNNECTPPAQLKAVERTDSTATIGFKSYNTDKTYVKVAANWIKIADVADASKESFIKNDSTSSKSYLIEGLEADTKYYYYLRSACNSEWVGDSLRTPCNTVTDMPYRENFDSYPVNSIPDCWSRIYSDLSSPNPRILSSGGNSAPNYLYFPTTGTYAVSPKLNVDNLNVLRTRFYTKGTIADARLIFGVMSNPDDASTFIPMDTLNTSTAWTSNELWLDRYSGDAKYMAFYAPAPVGSQTNGIYMDDLVIDSIPKCIVPKNLNGTNITSSSATVEWSAEGAASAYLKVSLTPLSSMDSTAKVFDGIVMGTTKDLTNLYANTTYYFYVRSICDNGFTSEWSPEGSFGTTCPEFASIPLRESFDKYGTGTGTFPDCWTILMKNGDYPYIYAESPSSAPGSLFFNSSVSTQNLVATPPLDVANINTLSVHFKKRGSAVIIIGVMSDMSDVNTFIPVDTITQTGAWSDFSVPLTNYTGTGKYVAFKVINDIVYLDDVVITPTVESDCSIPNRLRTTRISASNARLAWGDNGSTAGYFNVKVSSVPIDPAKEPANVATIDSVGNLYYLLPGLSSSTTYYFYVQAICGENDRSYWSEAGTFTTICPSVTLPLVENFDSYGVPASASDLSIYPSCWKNNVQAIGEDVSDSYTKLPYIVDDGLVDRKQAMSLYFEPYYYSLSSSYKYTILDAISPEIDGDIKNVQVSFRLSSPEKNNATLTVGVASDWADPSTFVPVDTFSTKGVKSTWVTHIANFRDYKGNGKFVVFRANGLDIQASTKIKLDLVVISAIPAYAAPVKVRLKETDATTAAFSWKAGDALSNQWEYVVSDSLFADAVLNSENAWNKIKAEAVRSGIVNTPEFSVSGLDVGSVYYFYVKNAMSEEAPYYPSAIAFTTKCFATTLPYVQNFNIPPVSGYASAFPECWSRITAMLGTNSYPTIAKLTYTTETKIDTCLTFYTNGGTPVAITPELAISDISKIRVRFRAYISQASVKMIVGLMSDPDNVSSFVPVDTVTTSVIGNWENFKIAFDKQTGTYKYVAFMLSGRNSFFYIDDMVIEEIPACDFIEELVLADKTGTSFSVQWKAGEGQAWEVAYGETGFNPDTASYTTVSNPSFTAYGLTGNKEYDVYVRGKCSETAVSTWVSLTVLLKQTPAVVPYIFAFEDAAEEAMWVLENGTQKNRWVIGTGTNDGGGTKSLYISDNGTSYQYDNKTASKVFAYRMVDLPGGVYDISYKWKSVGKGSTTRSSTDFLRAVMVLDTVTLEAGKNSEITYQYLYDANDDYTDRPAHRPGWINLSSEISNPYGNIYGMTDNLNWLKQQDEVEITTPGTYLLIFYWENSTTATTATLPAAIDSISIVPSSRCTSPTGLKVMDIDTVSATLSWVSYNADSWHLKVFTKVTSNPGTATDAVFDRVVDTNHYMIPGLDPGTTYYAYVKSECNNTWAGSGAFTTLCFPAAAQLDQDFTGISSIFYSTLPCWNIYEGAVDEIFDDTSGLRQDNNNTGGLWGINTLTLTGNNARLNMNGTSDYGNTITKHWLVTPPVALASDYALSFDLALTANNSANPITIANSQSKDRFMVIISDDYGKTWKRENAVVWNNETGAGKGDYVYDNIPNTGQNIKIDLSQYTGKEVRIAFYGESPDTKTITYQDYVNNNYSNNIHIDNIRVQCADEHLRKDTTLQSYPYRGYGFELSGAELNFSGDSVFTRFAKSSVGCDSIIKLDLHVIGSTYVHVSGEICESEAYTAHGFNETTAGIHEHYFTSVKGNDSIIVLDLKVNAAYLIEEKRSACPSALPVTWHGQLLQDNGIYYDRQTAATGCDSIYKLDFEVVKAIRTDILRTICTGGSVEFNGRTLTQTGIYTATYQNEYGCDSIVTLDLQVVDKFDIYKEVRICPNSSFSGYGFENLTESDIYTHEGVSVYGCDSVFTLRLIVARTIYTTIDAAICRGEVYDANGFYATEAGLYRDTVPAAAGCDSVITLNLTLMPDYERNESQTIDKTDLPYTYGDETFPVGTTSGVYTLRYKTDFGCDSIINLNLTVNEPQGLLTPSTTMFELAPNPVQRGERVIVQYTFNDPEREGLKVEVFNSLGVCVSTQQPDAYPVYIDGLNTSGVYLVRITTGTNKVLFGKVIVK